MPRDKNHSYLPKKPYDRPEDSKPDRKTPESHRHRSPTPREDDTTASHPVESRMPQLEKKVGIRERALSARYPSKSECDFHSWQLFDETIFSIRLCNECRAMNRKTPVEDVDEDLQKLVLNICSICRAAHNAVRTTKYMKHDVLIAKRKMDQE